MSRRRRIVLFSTGILFLLFVLAVGGTMWFTQSQYGRERIRSLLVSTLNENVNGSVYIGNITSGFFRGVTIDSFEIRDPDDSLFISTGPVSARYDLRDLLERRILLHHVKAEHPTVYLRQHENGEWNFRKVFASKTPRPPSAEPGFGEYVVIESAEVRNGTFLLTMPWRPRKYLRGAQRDSAIRYELARDDIDIRRTGEGFARTWRWTSLDVDLTRARVREPGHAGMEFQIADLRTVEEDPPFQFRNVRGTVRQLGDSIWVDIPHFDLPASAGRGTGKIVWGSNLPVRYDLHIVGDSVSMRDVAWIYPTLPTTGGGRALLDIRSQPRNPQLIDYILTDMDLRTNRSHLLGQMTFVLGGDTLGVKDVQLRAAPVNFDLLRTLNGEPFPYDWQGDITGTVKASGGNVARFNVEAAQFEFADANVPGARARGSAAGQLNIFAPALTSFRGFRVNVETLDLRTLQYLNSEFPRLQGTVSGTAVLDSLWLDVRFREAELFHHDGDLPVSRVTGAGRVTWGETYMVYDLDLHADSVSATTIQRSYPFIPLRGNFAGPIIVRGESPSLEINTTMRNAGGVLAYQGVADVDPWVFGARGRGTFENASLRTLLNRPDLPHTVLQGEYAVDVSGDSLLTLQGSASVALAPSSVGGITGILARAGVRFDSGVVHIDTLDVRTPANRLQAIGALSLRPDRPGTLNYAVNVQSLAEVNAMFANARLAKVKGTGSVTGRLTGSIDTLSVEGTIAARGVGLGSVNARQMTGSLSLRNITHVPSGLVTIAFDSIAAGFIPIYHMSTSVRLHDLERADFNAQFSGRDSMHTLATGSIVRNGATLNVQLDTAGIYIDSSNVYALRTPARIVADATRITVDSLVMARSGGGELALRDLAMGADSSIQGSLRTSGLDLSVLQLFGQTTMEMRGDLSANVDVSGKTGAPKLHGAIQVQGGSVVVPGVGSRFEDVTADIALQGDTIQIRTLSAATNGERRGLMSMGGTIVWQQWQQPHFALTAKASNFRAIDRRGFASLDISTSTPITLTGPYTAAILRGGILVNRGSVYIPELIRKRLVNLNDPELYDVIDTTLAENRSFLPAGPERFMQGLRMENVAVTVGDDVWLRSAEANIKLGGSLNVTLGAAGNDRSQVALQGALVAERGTYRLNVVPFVQPIFDVESGTLRFFGTPGLDPALNITAINTVRKPQQSIMHQDVRIRATIGGTLASPTLELSSADNLPLTQSDLLSYLITGEPAFALDYNSQTYFNQLAAVAIRSAGNVISSAIPRSVFDVVELQTAGARDPYSTARMENPTLYNLLNTRAILGKQLNNNLFLNFSTGFCAENFGSNLGFRLEYRFSRVYRVLFGLEPGSSELTCTRSSAAQSIQQTPPQLGIDLSRTWRF